jgi:phospholipid-binding lipoprotein MlaA
LSLLETMPALLLAMTPVQTGAAPPQVATAEAPATEQKAPASQAANDNPENDIIVTAAKRPLAPDPIQAVNLASFNVTQTFDKAFIGPISLAYKEHVPSPVRSGIHNFLYNLREPIVFLNFVLQLKFGKAAETAARFAINTTVGVGGVMDIAKRKPFKLPRRGNGFADTLGFYGIPNGPFMFLPIVGPTTVRDLFGGFVDRLILPVAVGTPFNSTTYTAPAGALGALDHRAEFDEELHILHDNVPNPYESSRDFYLRRRQAEIDYLKGKRTEGAAPMSENPLGYIPPSGVIVPPVVPTVPAPAPAGTDQPAAPAQPAAKP